MSEDEQELTPQEKITACDSAMYQLGSVRHLMLNNECRARFELLMSAIKTERFRNIEIELSRIVKIKTELD